MANHVTGTNTLLGVSPISLGELRQHDLLPLIGNPLFSEAEQLRANHFVHESEDIARLTRWGANVLTKIARRQAKAARQLRDRATRAALRQLPSTSFRSPRSRPCQPTSRWVPGAFFSDGADRRASIFDRLVAARFQSVDALPFASLRSGQSR
ncbi:hypothetical protein EAH73_21385 [Hymenobacter nivis]|uniref:Uncharacterized protein n=1 Tax=Hymenobacter nivis TaxID=1850093 RepID=A0A502GD87_9BACT|nr:hypothetical protein EAH73_21385 [Hymenobacter nivis]